MAMWTQERIDNLKKWADEGVSYGVIAKRLGVTRNSVIGKANREKLPARIGNIREAAFKKRVERERRKVARAVRAQEREREKALKKPPQTDVTPDIQSLIAIPTNNYLTHGCGCKWPHGEVCGQEPLPLKSYCAEHEARSRA